MQNAIELAELVAQLHEASDVEETVETVLECAVQVVDCDSCGVMLVHAGRRIETNGVTDPVVARADELQMIHDDGPCLAAIREDGLVRISDTAAEPRFPTWGPEVAALGLRSVLGVRMGSDPAALGAINLYSSRADAFDDEDVALARILARHAGIALRKVRREAKVEHAIDGRTSIGQAQGILMERYGIDPDQAFAVLRRYSQHTNVRLRDVARRIADERRLPPSTVEGVDGVQELVVG